MHLRIGVRWWSHNCMYCSAVDDQSAETANVATACNADMRHQVCKQGIMLANALSSKQMIKFAYAAPKHLHAMLAGPSRWSRKELGCGEHAAMCSPAVLGGTFSMLRDFCLEAMSNLR